MEGGKEQIASALARGSGTSRSPEAPGGPAAPQREIAGQALERGERLHHHSTVYGEGGASLAKYCKVTLDRLPLGHFSKD